MANFRIDLENPVPLILLIPTYSVVSGVEKKTFPAPEAGVLIYGSFKTYGGTERNVNGLYAIEDTAVIETWYRPDIKSDCRIYEPGSDVTYDIISAPEDIAKRHQFSKFKVKAVRSRS